MSPYRCLAAVAVAGITAFSLILTPAGAADPYRIVPGVRIGMVRANSTLAELQRAYGADQVRPQTLLFSEGEKRRGAVIFPNDRRRRFEVTWLDERRQRRPELARVTGRSTAWSLPGGIRVGTPSVELERLNGRPFEHTGFGWDLGGNVTEWQRGKLERPLKGSALTLEYDASVQLSEAEARDVLGDQKVRSNHPVARRMKPRVATIWVYFNRP